MEINSKSLQVTRNFVLQINQAQKQLEALQLEDKDLKLTIRALRRIRTKLIRPLRIAVLGDLNAGKSSLANILIGNMSLPTRAIGNTRIPTLIHYSETPSLMALFDNGYIKPVSVEDLTQFPNILRLDVGLPNQNLNFMQILDFPGLSTIEMDEGEFDVTEHQVDAALWCTMGTAAWRENELDAWLSVPERLHARSLLVVTRKDQLPGDQVDRVKARLKHEAGEYFHDITFVSATQAKQAVQAEGESKVDVDIWAQSGAQDFLAKLKELCAQIRMERVETAWKVTKRISRKTLAKI